MAEEIDITEFLEEIMKESTVDPVMYQYFHNLKHNRTIIFNRIIDSDVIENVYLPLREFEKDSSDEPITLIMNSDGGSVTDSFFIANYLTTYKKPLIMICTGSASSMATVLFAAGGKNPNITRYAYPSSYMLIHDGYVTLGGASEAKTATDIIHFNEKVDDKIRNFIIENTKISEKDYDSHARKQWFLFADEAKELGLIDKIYGVDE